MAAGQAGFLSTFITRGIGLHDASIALTGRVQCSIQILVLALNLNAGLVDAIAFAGRLQKGMAAFIEFGA